MAEADGGPHAAGLDWSGGRDGRRRSRRACDVHRTTRSSPCFH